ncbi:helix-turn-helix domain-containing protein [Streptomyces sp. NPDC059979]|uniref:helix-turn-helix domain-containing protein n=1 Tax=Streptomyces sp. NPDC059979 TaxID=3347021 RepID=UPI003681F619
MMKQMGFRWNLRRLMAARDMFQTTDLVPKLADYGIHLSREQVYRLVTQEPQRLSMDTLAALCGILQCTPADLIEVVEVRTQVVKPAVSGESASHAVAPPARRTQIRRPEGL